MTVVVLQVALTVFVLYELYFSLILSHLQRLYTHVLFAVVEYLNVILLLP
jgi:hypothetical protein